MTDNEVKTELLGALAGARAALIRTLDGLTDAQLAATPTASTLCLGGIVKHVTQGEAGWLRFVAEGPAAKTFDLPDGVTWDDLWAGTAREKPQWLTDYEREFRMAPGDTRESVLAAYATVARRTEEIVTALPDMSASWPVPEAPWQPAGESWSARQTLLHVLTETHQHTGHAEIIRETLTTK